MNNLIQSVFLYLLPFYPLIAWAYHFVTEKPLELLLNVLLFPVAIYFLTQSKKRLPTYLIFFILFTIFHLGSVLMNNTIPSDTNSVYFIISDINFFACTLLIIVENIFFSEKFMEQMNRNIFIVVTLTLVVSLIQLKEPTFMFDERILLDEEFSFWGEEVRNTSFYSFVNTNSLGITFPIFIAILLNYYESKKKYFAVIALAGIIVSFLSKSRYVMISTLIAFSQLLFSAKKSFISKISIVLVFVASVFLAVFIANQVGFDVDEVITNRILEKDTEMGSAKSRVTSYEVFLLKFPENPWIGVGPKTRPDVVALLKGEAPLIHVGYLSYLYFYGVIGCFFIFGALFYLLKNAWQVGKRYNFWGSFYGLLTFCMANVTFVYFNFAEVGVILAILYLKFHNQEPEEEEEVNELSNTYVG